MKRLFALLLLVGATGSACGAAAVKISEYPNASVLVSNYLFLIANPGITNYHTSFGQMTNQLQSEMKLRGSNVIQSLKQPFSTNYTITVLDEVSLANGTNQVLTLPNCTNTTTPAGVTVTISTTNANGSFIATNANGFQTVGNGIHLSFTNAGAGVVEFVNQGGHWWFKSLGVERAQYATDNSDIVVGTAYTNGLRPVNIMGSFQLTAAAAGTAKVTVYSILGTTTNKLSVSAGPLASLVTIAPLFMVVQPNGYYYYADETSGSGASISFVAGTHTRAYR